MAAPNFTPIQLYYSTTASAAPTAANLAQGELAINITDGKLYYEDGSGVVQVIASKGAGTIGGSNTQIQYNNAGALAGNAAMTFNSGTNTVTLTTLNLTNALGAIYGGTAQSTYTQGDVLYASAANTLSKLGIGTVNYILTSSGSVPQWSAPSSISVLTATNLAGGVAGSVPYQSAVDTTTFLAIGAANRVMTSTGSAPQWVTSLTSLTGVSSSSITNTSLTSGRVVYSGASGVETDSANLTFNGTTLSAGGFSTTGLSTLVQTVKIGDSNFSGVAVFAPATPAKLYIGTGTVTDATSAIGATNATGAISSLAITPIAATNTSVTYTNASTLYIAGAPSAGTNITITNPYALYVNAGASYLGGNTAVTGTLSASLNTSALPAGPTGTILQIGQADGVASNITIDQFGGTTGGIMFRRTTGTNAAKTATNLATQASIGFTGYGATGYSASSRASVSWRTTEAWTDSAQGCSILISATPTGSTTTAAVLTISGSELAVTGTFSSTLGATIQGLTVGLGAGAVSTNTAVGVSALAANTSGAYNTAVGYQAGFKNIGATFNTFIGRVSGYNNETGTVNTALGNGSLYGNISGANNVAIGSEALAGNTSGAYNTALGTQAGYNNISASYNTAVGYTALFTNQTGAQNVAIGPLALYATTASNNTAVGYAALRFMGASSGSTAVGYQAAYSGGEQAVTAFGYQAGYSQAGASPGSNTWIGYQAGYFCTSGGANTALGYQAYANASNATGSYNTAIGMDSLRANTSGSQNTAVGYQAGYTNQTGIYNAYFGYNAGKLATGSGNTFVGGGTSGGGNPAGYSATGNNNNFFGAGAGGGMSYGSKNTILGNYNGNQGGLNITISDSNIVLSDGDGNPRAFCNVNGAWGFGGTSVVSSGAKVEVTGGLLTVNSGSSGTIAALMQCISGSVTAAASTVAKKIVFVNHTNSLRLNILAVAPGGESAGCASFSGVTNQTYGGGAGVTTTASAVLGGGAITAISVTYNNSGSPAYTIDVILTYTGSAPTIYWNIEGVSTANIYNV